MGDTFFLHAASVVSHVCLFFLLYNLTMLHAFPDDITRVSLSTYSSPSSPHLPFAKGKLPVHLIFKQSLSFLCGLKPWVACIRTLWRSRALQWPQQWVSMGGLSVSVPPPGCVWGKLQGCYGPINNGFIVWGILMLFTQALSEGFHVCQQQACPKRSDT